MSIRSLCRIHTVRVLKPHPTVSRAGTLDRGYVEERTVPCRVHGISAANPVVFAQMVAAEIDHNLWFDHDPKLTEGDVLDWEFNGVVTRMRVTKVPIDLHGLGRIWMGGAMTKRTDNTDQSVAIDPDTLL